MIEAVYLFLSKCMTVAFDVISIALGWLDDVLAIKQKYVEIALFLLNIALVALTDALSKSPMHWWDWFLYVSSVYTGIGLIKYSDAQRRARLRSPIACVILVSFESMFAAMTIIDLVGLVFMFRGLWVDAFAVVGPLVLFLFVAVTALPRDGGGRKRKRQRIADSVREWLSTLSWLPTPEPV